ncbi:MAG: RluA family pseudouridine synthase [Lachnospiraceae bacterium]|nr:RluA family pseudouridine synthase [Lachnospiraceae bacterium]
MIELEIRNNTAGQRLDKVLKKTLKEAPDSFIYKMLRKKNITLNHRKAEGKEKTEAGDRIQFFFSDDTFRRLRGVPEEAPVSALPKTFPKIQILHEDSDVLLFVKPAGVLSQKSSEGSFSANDWLIEYVREKGLSSGSEFEAFRPSIVNRLDQNTCGIMAAGISLRGLQVLSELFRDRTLSKYYYAIVIGQVSGSAVLKSYLVKNEKKNEVRIYDQPVQNGKEIRTEYQLVRYDREKQLSLLRVHLLTGRSHQIRAHLASIGHPILGDRKYGSADWNLYYRQKQQCLCSYRLEFPECALESISGKTFEIPVPKNWPVQPEEAK